MLRTILRGLLKHYTAGRIVHVLADIHQSPGDERCRTNLHSILEDRGGWIYVKGELFNPARGNKRIDRNKPALVIVHHASDVARGFPDAESVTVL